MGFECIRRIEWDAMHRIPNHEGACKAYHGHRYVAEIHCSSDQLDELGRVVDFGVIKEKVGGWIDKNLDHTAIFDMEDRNPVTLAIISENKEFGKPAFIMDCPPTAENIARLIYKKSKELLNEFGISIDRVRLWETPNCSAIWTENDN